METKIKPKEKFNTTFPMTTKTKNQLLRLKVYHNKTMASLLETLIENAFLQMAEATDLNKAKKLDDTKLNVELHSQQLALLIGEVRLEIEKLAGTEKSHVQNLNSKFEAIRTEMSNELKTVKKDIKDVNVHLSSLNERKMNKPFGK